MGAALLEKILDALTVAIPPADASDRHVARWRLAVGLISMSMPLALAVHILMSCGYIGPGFAQAKDVHALKRSIEDRQTTIERRLLEQSLLDTRAKQCAAMAANNMDAKAFAALRMADLQSDWRAIVGVSTNYPLPTCEELP